MPTYEYACKSCGEHLEVVQSFTDDALTECPACHGQLRKVFGNIGITFKGSGFYKNDSRQKAAASSSSGAESSSSSETKAGESKPAGESTSSPSKGSEPSTPASSTPASSGTTAAAS